MVKGKKIACPSCSRKFGTTAAMQQHKTAAHGGQNRQPNANATRQRRAAPRAGPGLSQTVLSGTDVLSTTYVQAGSQPGRVLVGVRISPRMLEGTRMAQLSECWGRWRPRSLRLRVMCAGAYTTYGTVIYGWTPDPNTTMTGTNMSNLTRVSACRPSAECRLNGSVVLNIPTESSRKWYLTSGQPDDTSHGYVIGVVGAITGGYSGSVSITMHLDWSMALEGVDLESDHVDDEMLRPDAGWDHLFTTSDGSYDSKVLTFKMHHGGSMVSWSAAHPARVYTLAGNTKVPYVNSAGQTEYCKYFAPIQGYSVQGMLLFASSEDAKAYIQSGDDTKALPYKTACSTEVTPAIPVLKQFSLTTGVGRDPEIDLLYQEINLLKLRVSDAMAPNTEVSDPRLQRRVGGLARRDADRPLGTVADPLFAMVEDPVRAAADEIERLKKELTEARFQAARSREQYRQECIRRETEGAVGTSPFDFLTEEERAQAIAVAKSQLDRHDEENTDTG